MKIKGNKIDVVCATRYKLDGIKCDVCERTIKTPTEYDKEYKYYRVTTGHCDWGVDSCDSIQCRDICPECLLDFIHAYFNENESPTAYIEIHTDFIYFNQLISDIR